MKPVRILLVLCSTLLACNRENPVRSGFGDGPLVKPRLEAPTRSLCPEPIDSRDRARRLLVSAEKACLDRTVRVIGKLWPDDLPAAYLVRAERNDDAVDLLRALDRATGVNRALALQELGLTADAIAAWNAVAGQGSAWSEEARRRRDALMAAGDPMEEWRRLHATPRKLAQTFPSEAARELLDSGLPDSAAARIIAATLAENGDPYLREALDAMSRPGSEAAMRAYRAACASGQAPDYDRAAALLERAGNPLHLYARFSAAAARYTAADIVRELDALIPATDSRYRMLASLLHMLRANALEQRSSYFLALPEYDAALGFAGQSATLHAKILSRRSVNHATVGSGEKGFRDTLELLRYLPQVPDLRTHTHAYGSAAQVASELGFHKTALLYRNAGIAIAQKALPRATADERQNALHVLAVAFRERANTHTHLKDFAAAEVDLRRAKALVEGMNKPDRRQYLRKRLHEVEGEIRMATDPAAAVAAFRRAIEEAEAQHSTYRAVLHFKLADARRRNGEAHADDDVENAFEILRKEATHLLDATKRGEYEDLWSVYFSRFQQRHRENIRSMVEQRKIEDAFVRDEQARAFEPLYVLQSRSAPPGFRSITSRQTLDRNLDDLPEDTVILQYLVLADRTYVWVLRRGEKIQLVRLRATEEHINGWREGVLEALHTRRPDLFATAMRSVYAELFSTPLRGVDGKHLVIVPDGPMHGLPFAALEATDGYLIERRVKSLATDGSTSRYLYARKRDAQFRQDGRPSVLLAAATVFNPAIALDPLPKAREEVEELHRESYPQAFVLRGAEVTVPRFLDAARGATIIHFAGHAIPFPRKPWDSQLMLAGGELTAGALMRELSQLERTRLVVLGACSTAGGQPVGPEGLAPLVRPIIAANVPAVVGTLWDVKDATAKDLLVSLHCHYRHGDDVAVALRAAQLERLQEDESAMTWAPYQVVGYARSPYGGSLEKTPNDAVCAHHSLQRSDGLHPE